MTTEAQHAAASAPLQPSAIAPLFPAGVIVETELACCDPVRAASKRQAARNSRAAERDAGRRAALRALRRLGCHEGALDSQANGAPVWPRGFVGSISHTVGQCISIVARRDDFVSVGVDIEPFIGIPPDLWSTICTPAELDWLRYGRNDQEDLARLIFSAKESVYKCQFPETDRFLEFTDVRLCLDLCSHHFSVGQTSDTTLDQVLLRILGSWAVADSWLVTFAALPEPR